ncbi:MAG: hypothetical protein ACXADY_20705 [Candidatus Hodarchaeales archaeon]|jgi:hypothetical protein
MGKISLIGIILMILVLVPRAGMAQDVEPEFKVKIGDKRTYVFTKYNNHGITEELGKITTINGSTADKTYKQGITFTVEVSNITGMGKDSQVYVTETHNGVTEREKEAGIFIVKTTDDEDYWEALAQNETDIVDNNNYTKTSVMGNILIFEKRLNWTTSDWYYYHIDEWDTKTGWLIHDYVFVEDKGTVRSEIEVKILESTIGIPGYESLNLFTSILAMVTVIVVYRRRLKKV